MISIERDGSVWRIEWRTPEGYRHERYAREPGDVAVAVVDAVRELDDRRLSIGGQEEVEGLCR